MFKTSVDEIDLKILKALSKNCRSSIVSISREIGVSRQTIGPKTVKLERNGVIKGYHVNLDLRALGLEYQTIITGIIDPSNTDLIVKKIISHPDVFSINILSQQRNLEIYTAHPDDTSLNDFLGQCNSIKGISDLNPQMILRKYRKNSSFNNKFSESPKRKKINVNRLDQNILRILKNNARIAYSEIARQQSIAGETISNHIRKLERQGLILGYPLLIDEKYLGFHVKAILKLRLNPRKLLSQIKILIRFPAIRQIQEIISNDELHVEIRAKDINDLYKFLKKDLQAVDHIIDTDVAIILKKYDKYIL